jgi:Domain of unknown function (DUF5060)/Protein of unknown function (DUF4038)/Domain of unknown function (DUF5605)
MRKNVATFVFAVVALVISVARADPSATVGQWGIYEISLKGPATGNPFVDVSLSAHFVQGGKSVEANGFYDGDGVYRVRFMPAEQGEWSYQTKSNVAALDRQAGKFVCGVPAAGNHGVVRVKYQYHFAYDDGSPYFELGTTLYNWVNQPEEQQDQTLATLKGSAFNKVRMCVFTTGSNHYAKPGFVPVFPYEGTPPKDFDYAEFNPAFFQHLEKRVAQLGDLGIEADVILFHPYNKENNFNNNTPENDDRYLKYIVARLAAYHNVWWSLANEYDLIRSKTDADWDRMFQVVQREDPYGHLRSVHQSKRPYDASKPWVTHLSIQNGGAVTDFARVAHNRINYTKPSVFDEVHYEGNLAKGWGNMSGEEMVSKFWVGTIGGAYVGHGEAFTENPWISIGGVLTGSSPPRLLFLKKILETAPAEGIDPLVSNQDPGVGGQAGKYYLLYFHTTEPTEWTFELPAKKLAVGTAMHVDVLDTWNMTITPVEQVFKVAAFNDTTVRAEGQTTVKLPGKPFIGMRITVLGK